MEFKQDKRMELIKHSNQSIQYLMDKMFETVCWYL